MREDKAAQMIGQTIGRVASKTPGSDGPQYQIQALLGQQKGRRTFLAIASNTGMQVVVKLLLFDPDFTWEDLKLFEREAETLKSLSHPAIPKYLDSFEVETPISKGFVLVQTFIEARSLKDWVTAGNRFSEKALKEIDRLRLVSTVSTILKIFGGAAFALLLFLWLSYSLTSFIMTAIAAIFFMPILAFIFIRPKSGKYCFLKLHVNCVGRVYCSLSVESREVGFNEWTIACPSESLVISEQVVRSISVIPGHYDNWLIINFNSKDYKYRQKRVLIKADKSEIRWLREHLSSWDSSDILK